MSKASKGRTLKFMSDWGTVVVIVLLLALFSILLPRTFPTIANFTTIIRSICIVTIMAMGKTFAIAVNGIDLSLGITATFACTTVTILFVWYELPAPFAILLTLLAVLFIGLCNAFLIVKVKVPPMLATLSMSFLFEGVYLTMSGGGAISETMQIPGGRQAVGRIPASFKQLGVQPWIFILMIVCVIFVYIFFERTKYGRYLYIVGDNPTVAKLSGISVGRYKTLAFMMCSFFGGVAGLVICARTGGAQIGSGVGYQMPAVSATFIGVSLAGKNKANALGTFFGAVLVGVLENGLTMVGVPYYSLNIVKGAVLAIAVTINYMRSDD